MDEQTLADLQEAVIHVAKKGKADMVQMIEEARQVIYPEKILWGTIPFSQVLIIVLFVSSCMMPASPFIYGHH